MFSKPLFKQSIKANGVMWLIITGAICFMLSCVMLISGSGNIGKVKNSIEDTIITGEIDAVIEKKAINYYELGKKGMVTFDQTFVSSYEDNAVSLAEYQLEFEAWMIKKPSDESGLAQWNSEMPLADNIHKKVYALSYQEWLMKKPTSGSEMELSTWLSQKPTTQSSLVKSSYLSATIEMEKAALLQLGKENVDSYFDEKYQVNQTLLSSSEKEIFAAFLIGVNPNQSLSEMYFKDPIEDYDISNLLIAISENQSKEYCDSTARRDYHSERATLNEGVFLSVNFTSEEAVIQMIDALEKYGVTKEKYDSFNYTYDSILNKAKKTTINYQGQYEYECAKLDDKLAKNEITLTEYQDSLKEMDNNLQKELTNSLLSSLPEEVSVALEEVGQMDLYSLIVGSIFFKMAGLLLPIIYTIMASNNLISSQVDSGSMAYVLSTGTKRKTVVFTQSVYLVLSLLLMFLASTITSFICLSIVKLADISLTYGKLALINLGAFLVLFAISGINFLTSSIFDRSRRSMSIGGGISIFFLVATILGLFGSPVIPSIIRLDALNMFNYVSIISLFDVVSIIDGTNVFLWKMGILIGIGLVSYLVGSTVFIKKDLPL